MVKTSVSTIYFRRKLLLGILSVVAGFFFFYTLCPFVYAQSVKKAHTRVEFISEVKTIRSGTSFLVALKMTMDKQWHTYWQNPGDSGLATSIDWHLPEGFQASKILWPYPAKIDLPPLSSYGYEGEVFLLTRIDVPNFLEWGEDITFEADVKWLACKVDCIPGEAKLNFKLPVTPQLPGENRAFAEVREKIFSSLPQANAWWKISGSEDKKDITLAIAPRQGKGHVLKGVHFFPYEKDVIDHAANQKLHKTNHEYMLTIPKSALDHDPLRQHIEGIFVSRSGWQTSGTPKAIYVKIPVNKSDIGQEAFSNMGLDNMGIAIVFAFLGGLILNLMPCVLPVLSIKVLNLLEQAHKDRKTAFMQGLLFTLGILVVFWILAALMLILKWTGTYVGWGFQFQSSYFLVFMSVLFFYLGLNLFGIFEIGTSLTRAGGILKSPFIIKSPFFNGMLTTIVATPCTAPFMGSALGFALGQPPVYAWVIFTFLGLGLACPYVMLTCFPVLLKFVPKPGPWMIKLKMFFGFLFMATVAWLAWVLSLQNGSKAVAVLFIGLFMIGVAIWIWEKWGVHGTSPKKRSLARKETTILLLVGFILVFKSATVKSDLVSPSQRSDTHGISWVDYSQEAVNQALGEGRPVFIDFTAAWCLTCQVNDRVALRHPDVVKRFKELGIVAVKADWTNHDERITQALASYGKTSIPLYIFYSSMESAPVTLPEIITPGIVLDALDKNLVEQN